MIDKLSQTKIFQIRKKELSGETLNLPVSWSEHKKNE